jgi:hypothetical protein
MPPLTRTRARRLGPSLTRLRPSRAVRHRRRACAYQVRKPGGFQASSFHKRNLCTATPRSQREYSHLGLQKEYIRYKSVQRLTEAWWGCTSSGIQLTHSLKAPGGFQPLSL